MTKNNTKRRPLKGLREALRNAPLICLTATVSVSLEAFGWGYIFLTNTRHSDILGVSIPLALIEAVIISATGLLALIAAFVAAERRQDPRPSQRRKAWPAQILAVVLILPPAAKAADSFAFPAQLDRWSAYVGSDQHRADVRKASDPTLDSIAQLQAATALSRAVRPTRAEFDLGAWVWAAFLYGSNMLAASLLWRARPETPAEQTRRLRGASIAKARATREAKKQAELEASQPTRPGWFRGIFTGARRAS